MRFSLARPDLPAIFSRKNYSVEAFACEIRMGHAKDLPKFGSVKDLLLPDSVSELEVDEEADTHLQVLYTVSFEELASKNVNYDTIIWLSISPLLVLAWGIGIIMLLYLPFRRYVLQKDIGSRNMLHQKKLCTRSQDLLIYRFGEKQKLRSIYLYPW